MLPDIGSNFLIHMEGFKACGTPTTSSKLDQTILISQLFASPYFLRDDFQVLHLFAKFPSFSGKNPVHEDIFSSAIVLELQLVLNIKLPCLNVL